MEVFGFYTHEEGKTRTEIQQASVHGRTHTNPTSVHTHRIQPPQPPTPTLTLLTYNLLCHHLALSPRRLSGDVTLLQPRARTTHHQPPLCPTAAMDWVGWNDSIRDETTR